MAIAGNFQLRPDELRDRGLVGYLEYAPISPLAVGASTMVTHASTDLETQSKAFRQAHGLFARYTPAKPWVFMAEADALVVSPKSQPMSIGGAGLLQADYEPVQGVHVGATGEILTPQFEKPASLGGWLTAFWFFLPHMDVRADFVYRSSATSNSRMDVVTFMGQIHGWL